MLSTRAAALTLAAAAFAVVFTFAAQAAPMAGAQAGEALVSVAAPPEAANEGDENVTFEISIADVEDLAAFQFIMVFDPDVLEFTRFEQGEFLGSSGREVVCNEPLTDIGSVRIQCVTLRASPAGASGGGRLASMIFAAKGSGDTEVRLDRLQLSAFGEDAPEIPARTESITFSVKGSSGFNWLIWGPVIGAAVVVVAGGAAYGAMRMRSSGKPAATTT